MDVERRQYARKRISTAVSFHESEGALLRGWLHDISRGGCFIASPSQLTFGETLELELRLPGVYAQITGTGSVVWVRDKSEPGLPAGMGIRFVAVAESSLAAIDGLSGTGARLSRPSTIIGIAPAPATSSLAIAPDIALPAPEPALPSPVVVVHPKRARWIIAAVLMVLAVVALAVGLRVRHRTMVTVDAATFGGEVPLDVVSDASALDAVITGLDVSDAASIVDAGTPDARVRKPKPKPKHR
jgi:uncharacterized protein (TIGR02266 family)